jgi:hypothetical protein
MMRDNEFISCRRLNYVGAAYVEAAIRIDAMFGSDRAYWILIRQGVPAAVVERVLKGAPRERRHKTKRYATARDAGDAATPADSRADTLNAQRVEVALVFQSMLGTAAAAEYLRNAGVPVWISARVLGTNRRRPSVPLVVD